MNLRHIKSVLINLMGSSTLYYDKNVKELIDEIDGYLQQEELLTGNNQNVLRTVNSYVATYEQLIEDYNGTPNDKLKLRIDKVTKILSTLSGITIYLDYSLSDYNCEELKDKNPDRYKIVRVLAEKAKLFKDEKFSWSGILKALERSIDYNTNLLKTKMYSKDT